MSAKIPVEVESKVSNRTTIKKSIPEPEGWKDIWNILSEERKKFVAPVDTMGCDQLHDKAASKDT